MLEFSLRKKLKVLESTRKLKQVLEL